MSSRIVQYAKQVLGQPELHSGISPLKKNLFWLLYAFCLSRTWFRTKLFYFSKVSCDFGIRISMNLWNIVGRLWNNVGIDCTLNTSRLMRAKPDFLSPLILILISFCVVL